MPRLSISRVAIGLSSSSKAASSRAVGMQGNACGRWCHDGRWTVKPHIQKRRTEVAQGTATLFGFTLHVQDRKAAQCTYRLFKYFKWRLMQEAATINPSHLR